MNRLRPAILRALGLVPVLLCPATVHSAPGTLADTPLFLTTSAEPNIMFVIDDSGSMDWEIMSRDLANGGLFTGTQPDGSSPSGSGSVKHRDDDDNGTADCGFGDGTFYGYLYGVEFGSNRYGDDNLDCNTADDESWRFRNHDFNPLYFDPTRDYQPWPGVDANGAVFGDIDIHNAPDDPYNPQETIDLTVDNSDWEGVDSNSNNIRRSSDRNNDGSPDGFRFYTWSDADSDGLFDDGEQTEYRIADLTDAQAAQWGKTAAEVQQDFANWFGYYRSRELVAKAAYANVIAEVSGVRMGLVTLNSSASNTPAVSMNADPASGAKRTLLDALYGFHPNGSTSLRTAFYNTGRYLECQSNSFGFSCPALPASNGGQCQQNFSVVMTDGFYNGSFSSVANTDGDNDSSWDSGTAGPFGDSYSATLGDIAMDFYERDLFPSVVNDVPTKPGIDENSAQHLVTYTVSFGVDGSLTLGPANQTDPFTWPDPGSADSHKIDDLRHAAFNGRGQYLSSQDPSDLYSAINGAVSSIRSRTGSAAAVAFNSSTLSTNSQVYLALFNSSRWSGDLAAFPLNAVTGAVQSTPAWLAATALDNRDLTTQPRTMFTFSPASSDGVPFQWSDLSTAQQDDLRTGPSGTLETAATGMARLAWLRGERSCEQNASGTCSHSDGSNTFSSKSLRPRDSRLGDFIHSSPVYVGPPELHWPDNAPFPDGSTGTPYSQYKIDHKTRQGVIYIGGNDGMLHGFRESDGAEVLAYVPRSVYSGSTFEGLHYLTDPNYSHHYYVDLRPTVIDAYIKTDPAGSVDWHTVLLGGLRGGGPGLFALDVTNPAAFSESGSNPADVVMWEFTDADDSDLGYTYSRPSVALMNNGRWAAVFGNGYNDNGNGTAQLFIVFLDGGLDGTWTLGTDYLKIDTQVGSTVDRNGLATPALVDLDGDGVADRAYAGDLTGRMWAFDLSSTNTGQWDVAHKSGSTPVPLFTGPSSPAQPITTLPIVVGHPTESTVSSNRPNLLVLFGTGQYLTPSDPNNTDIQSFYGVWDNGDPGVTRTNLTAQTLSIGLASNGEDARLVSDNNVAWTASPPKRGWYIDLNAPAGGERMVVDPVVRGDRVFFNTTIPNNNPCDSGGSGWLLSVDYANGGEPDDPVFDINGDGKVTSLDLVGGDAPAGRRFTGGLPTNSVFLGNNRYTSGTDIEHGLALEQHGHDAVEDLEGDDTGRFGWEELIP